jgi:hypothetical protein
MASGLVVHLRKQRVSCTSPPALAAGGARTRFLSRIAPVRSAMHESGVGPSRHIVPRRDLGRYRGIAEIVEQPAI